MEMSEQNDTAPTEDAGLAAMRAEIAKIQAEESGETAPAPAPATAEPTAPSTNFSDALAAAGIGHNVSPKPEAEAAEPAAPESPPETSEAEPDRSGQEALEAALSGRRKTREEQMAERDAILSRAKDLQLPDSIAKALANNADRKEAEQYLANLESKGQNDAAGQPAAEPSPVPQAGAQPSSELAEIRASLGDALGEETAEVVTRLFENVVARAERAEAAAQSMSNGVVGAKAQDDLMAVAKDLSGQYPEILQGNVIHPVIGQVAADLYGGTGPLAGDVRLSLEAACRLTAGANAAPGQPIPNPATPSPTSHPRQVEFISPEQFAERAAVLAQRHLNDEAAFERELAALEREVAQTNKLAKQRGMTG